MSHIRADDVGYLLIRGECIDDVLGEDAHHDGEDEGPREPSNERWSMEPHSESERFLQRGVGVSWPTQSLEKRTSKIASAIERQGETGKGHPRGERQHENPPMLACCRPGLFLPTERRQPGHPTASRIANSTQHIRSDKRRHRPHVDASTVERGLGDHRGETGEHKGQATKRQRVQQRAARWETGGEQHDEEDSDKDRRRRPGLEQRAREGSEAIDPAG